MAVIDWLHRRAGSRVSLAVLVLVAVAGAVGAANAIVPKPGSISSSAASSPDGVTIVTLNSEGTPTFRLYCRQAMAAFGVRPGALNSDGSMKIGTVHNMSWSGCSAPAGAQVKISLADVWQVSAFTPLTGGEGIVRIDGIAVAAEVTSGCSLSVRGSINAELNLDEKTLAADPESADLTVSEVEGCFGVVMNGNKATVEGAFILP